MKKVARKIENTDSTRSLGIDMKQHMLHTLERLQFTIDDVISGIRSESSEKREPTEMDNMIFNMAKAQMLDDIVAEWKISMLAGRDELSEDSFRRIDYIAGMRLGD